MYKLLQNLKVYSALFTLEIHPKIAALGLGGNLEQPMEMATC
jgi:hypothetical protein